MWNDPPKVYRPDDLDNRRLPNAAEMRRSDETFVRSPRRPQSGGNPRLCVTIIFAKAAHQRVKPSCSPEQPPKS